MRSLYPNKSVNFLLSRIRYLNVFHVFQFEEMRIGFVAHDVAIKDHSRINNTEVFGVNGLLLVVGERYLVCVSSHGG